MSILHTILETIDSVTQKLLDIHPIYKILLDIENKVKHLSDPGGDGDEYPTFRIMKEYGNKYLPFGTVMLGYQSDPQYEWKGNGWEDTNSEYPKVRKIKNLKQDILSYYAKCKKEWQEEMFWDEDSKKVIQYIDKLIQIIKGSRL